MLNTVLDLISGISWTLVYILAVLMGVRYKTFCIPGISICVNICWEFWIVIARTKEYAGFITSFVAQIVWLVLDVLILATWFRYENKKSGTRAKKLVILILIFILMYFVVYRMRLFGVSAYVDNMLMSTLFICRLHSGKDKVRSKAIAMLKLIGTLSATVLNGVIFFNPFILWMGGVCLLLDIYYMALLSRRM